MNITRRSLLQGIVVTAATLSTGTGQALAVPPVAVLVYDGLLPESRSLKERHAGRAIDLAAERSHRWRQLRDLESREPIAGLTTWSDLVQVRAALEPKGLRLQAQARCGRLYYWEMA